MFRIMKIFLIFLSCLTALNTFAFENLVYTWRGFPDELGEGKIAIQDLQSHAKDIDILSSQAYHITETGLVYGNTNPTMDRIAKENGVKILPLVGNINFDRQRVHLFLHNKAAQERAIASILQLCKKNNYAGVQIDFEAMDISDRDAFSNFFRKVATSLHQNHLLAAVAIIPILPGNIQASPYLKSRYGRWSGVYDYKVLGKYADFITLMTYDQHGAITPPGPVAGKVWCEEIIKYALQHVPPQKISLGIPWHSNYWFTGQEKEGTDPYDTTSKQTTSTKIADVEIDIPYTQLQHLLRSNHVTLRWEPTDEVPYVFYRNNFLYEYIFAEDAASLKAKINLVKKYKLRGISSWVLGEEDPKIWQEIKERNASVTRPNRRQ